jgi:hypothetical protein
VRLDECIDWRLARELTGHEVKTARQMGWATLKNGELRALVCQHFDVLVTVDQNLPFQQFGFALDYHHCPSRKDKPACRSQAADTEAS